MTNEERDQISGFLHLLERAQAAPKDGDAEALIRQSCARQPDATYLLVQRALQLEIAQQAAQAEIARLKKELEQARSGLPASAFLGGTNAWGRPLAAPAPSPAPVAAMPQAAAPASNWGSGLLGTVATTAAGVVAGSLLYQGISSLMGQREGAHAAIPPGGGTGVDTDYADAARREDADGGTVAEDFDSDDRGDFGDVG